LSEREHAEYMGISCVRDGSAIFSEVWGLHRKVLKVDGSHPSSSLALCHVGTFFVSETGLVLVLEIVSVFISQREGPWVPRTETDIPVFSIDWFI
jgi:hypothetical protein